MTVDSSAHTAHVEAGGDPRTAPGFVIHNEPKLLEAKTDTLAVFVTKELRRAVGGS